MEAMVTAPPSSIDALAQHYAGQGVFLTGHTGFKGSWLAMWLARLGARVHGYALPPFGTPGLCALADVPAVLASNTFADIRDAMSLTKALQAAQPQVVFHLAAQSLVRPSYRDPVATWATNVMGTAHLLDAVRQCPSVQAVVVVTTDKCYENNEWLWGYRETDPLGGHDPYSASKASAELVVQSFRRSFFQAQGPLLASARAGNVIGGGDWSEDRLLPDAVRATAAGEVLSIRSPAATRPWQHVLESLHGYLLLGARLLGGDRSVAEAFNFGPEAADNRSVAEVMDALQQVWPELRWKVAAEAGAPHEASYLYLDSSKAQRVLGWQPRWRLQRALHETAHWYRSVLAQPAIARALCHQQIDAFGQDS
jgi:CDP-glucose 4,6-dehydratase